MYVEYFSFDEGLHPIVLAVHDDYPDGFVPTGGVTGKKLMRTDSAFEVGDILSGDLKEVIFPQGRGFDAFNEVRALASKDVQRLYEAAMNDIQNHPSEIVRLEWERKEMRASQFLAGNADVAPVLLAGLTTAEKAEFISAGVLDGPSPDDVNAELAADPAKAAAVATQIATEIVRAALEFDAMLVFAGASRRDANDLLAEAIDYQSVATTLLYIYSQFQSRIDAFLAASQS